MSLFQNSVLNKYLKGIDSVKMEKAWNAFKLHFHNPEIQENIRNSKEEQYQGEFLIDLFVNVFGYIKNPNPNFNLTTELKNIKGAKKTDGAILQKEKAIAVIELKGTNTVDLTKVETQAFGYKNNQPGCKYVITSNFEKLRFYIDNAVDYEEFNLFQLTKEKFDILYICLSEDNLLRGVPKLIKDESLAQEETITKKLYKEYSEFRNEIFDSIQNNNPQYDKLTLFKKTQKLLDRFLFIFFAEDRLLVPPNSIDKIVKKWKDDVAFGDVKPLYTIFKQYFNVLNNGRKAMGNREEIFAYNGGLFKPDSILDTIIINDDILFKHTVRLSNYDFESEVSVNILGHIFEHSLTEIETIQAQLAGVEIDKNKAKRKKDGVFYTPKYITKYIVENTIGKICEDKKAEIGINENEFKKDRKGRWDVTLKKLLIQLDSYREWLLQLTICDPACGSGAFLNQALEFLIKEHQFIDELKAKLLGGAMIFTEVQNDILENNIFGVDINEESVEIAKLSLWLRTAKKGRKLTALNDNIKCGNSLIENIEIDKENAFNWNSQFPEIFKKGGFDIVIGNPPYVRVQNLSSEHVDYFFNNYKSPSGKLDVSILFFEKTLELINENGIASFISSSQWMQTNYGKNIRKLMLGGHLDKIVDFGSLPVFQDADTYPAIFFLANKNFQSFSYSKVPNKEFLNYSSISSLDSKSILYKTLSDEAWEFDGFKLEESLIKSKIKFKKLSEIGKANIGDLTGMDKAFVLTIDEAKLLELEDDLLYPYAYRGNEVSKYITVFPKSVVIYPYSRGESGKPELIVQSILKSKYPNIYNHLYTFKDELRLRKDSRKLYADGDNWYRHLRAGNFEYISPEKLIFKGVENKFTAGFLDSNTVFNGANSPAIIIKDENYTIHSIVVILNSKVSTYYLNRICPKKLGGYFRYNATNVSKFPIPDITSEQIDILHRKGVKMKSFYEKQLEATNKFKRSMIRNFDLDKLSRNLDNWYELTYAEFTKELKKKNVNLSLDKEAEWEDYFIKEQESITLVCNEINTQNEVINKLIYKLYNLSEVEIEMIEESLT